MKTGTPIPRINSLTQLQLIWAPYQTAKQDGPNGTTDRVIN